MSEIARSTRRPAGRWLWLWGPVGVQMALLFAASSIPDPGALPGGLPDYVPHAGGYALLGGLALRAMAGGAWAGVSTRRAGAAAAFAVLYGVTDELHQTLVPGRTLSVVDLAVDAAGAVLAVAAIRAWGIIVATRAGGASGAGSTDR